MTVAMRLHARRVALAASLATLIAIVAAAPTRSQRMAFQLDFNAQLGLVADPSAPCPPGSLGSVCPLRTVRGAVKGLGAVNHASAFVLGVGPPWCSEGNAHVLPYAVRWVVANKGQIEFAVAEVPGCYADEPSGVGAVKQTFTITGGTGAYAGASGSGHVQATVYLTQDGKVAGFENWTGTLTVPSRDFDTSPPTVSGATPRTVRAPKGAKSVRVTYKVTATDNVDTQVLLTCTPRSGSRFPIGRTTVNCEATDSSANTTKAAFRITVTRTR